MLGSKYNKVMQCENPKDFLNKFESQTFFKNIKDILSSKFVSFSILKVIWALFLLDIEKECIISANYAMCISVL